MKWLLYFISVAFFISRSIPAHADEKQPNILALIERAEAGSVTKDSGDYLELTAFANDENELFTGRTTCDVQSVMKNRATLAVILIEQTSGNQSVSQKKAELENLFEEIRAARLRLPEVQVLTSLGKYSEALDIAEIIDQADFKDMMRIHKYNQDDLQRVGIRTANLFVKLNYCDRLKVLNPLLNEIFTKSSGDLFSKTDLGIVFLLAQHADNDIGLQKRALRWLRASEVEQQRIFYLRDRVRVNSGRRQLYGTQVGYSVDGVCAPAGKGLKGGIAAVARRRRAGGLEDLEAYYLSSGCARVSLGEGGDGQR